MPFLLGLRQVIELVVRGSWIGWGREEGWELVYGTTALGGGNLLENVSQASSHTEISSLLLFASCSLLPEPPYS